MLAITMRPVTQANPMRMSHVWIQDALGRTMIDTEATDVWPLADDDRRLLQQADDMFLACKRVQNWLKEYIGQHGSDPMDGGLAEMHNEIQAIVAKVEG